MKLRGSNATTGTGPLKGSSNAKPALGKKGQGTAGASAFKGSKGTKR